MEYAGMELLDFQYKKMVVEKWEDKYNAYLVIEEDMPEHHRLIMAKEDIERYISNQENLKASKERSEQRELEEFKRQQEEDFRNNNSWGFADSLSPMQKGKILKVLNKQYNYYSDGKYIDTMTRKDFIKSMLEKGYYIEHKQDVRCWGKNGEVKITPNEYRLTEKEGGYYIITKIEYF